MPTVSDGVKFSGVAELEKGAAVSIGLFPCGRPWVSKLVLEGPEFVVADDIEMLLDPEDTSTVSSSGLATSADPEGFGPKSLEEFENGAGPETPEVARATPVDVLEPRAPLDVGDFSDSPDPFCEVENSSGRGTPEVAETTLMDVLEPKVALEVAPDPSGDVGKTSWPEIPVTAGATLMDVLEPKVSLEAGDVSDWPDAEVESEVRTEFSSAEEPLDPGSILSSAGWELDAAVPLEALELDESLGAEFEPVSMGPDAEAKAVEL